jgi:hypothetical protein
MSATVYYAGADELAVLTNTFTVAGVSTDPTAVVLTITDPTGAQTIPSTTKLSTGKYTATISCTLAGVWTYEWDGSGTASDIIAGTWTVGTVALNTFYCTNEELKSRLGIGDTADDFEVTLAVQAASRSIDEIAGRYFWRGPSTDVRTYIPTSYYDQEIDDLVTVTSVKADRDGDGVYEETWVQGTDYQLQVSPGHYNTTALGETWPYTRFNIVGPKFIPVVWPWSHLDRIQVTGVFGWPAVPMAVKQAALIAAADLFKLKDAPFGIAGFGEFAVRIQQNPRVLQLLHRYINGRRVGV